ncbi:copper ABC transporter permease [Bacillus shivajii]|uniref:ABC transporter permease n=1 Tax=Bacillus shivajii TaxID=1983719 RepID=UPI001CFBF3A2|nr:copper ABC transporter permease [Bacillus shivajii]UCZ54051.1 copper ABC transporter permease [Bacillus shivajii]
MYIWKEWMEQIRGKGLWLSMGMVIVMSLFIFIETMNTPIQYSFQALLISLHEMHVYLLPLLCLFVASFTIMQEKELKTLMMIVTKKESYRTFLLKKSIAINSIVLTLFLGWYIILAVPMRMFLGFDVGAFLAFLLTVTAFILIFNQIGLFIGTICTNRMQVVGATVFVWFSFVFLFDLILLYQLPMVTHGNVFYFSLLFFLQPLNALRLYLETSVGVFSLEYMSYLMDQLIWLSPTTFLWLNVTIFLVVFYGVAVWSKRKGLRYD